MSAAEQYDSVWLNVFIDSAKSKNIFHGLNGIAMHSNKTGKTKWFYAADHSLV